jgi:hypothetical protein
VIVGFFFGYKSLKLISGPEMYSSSQDVLKSFSLSILLELQEILISENINKQLGLGLHKFLSFACFNYCFSRPRLSLSEL